MVHLEQYKVVFVVNNLRSVFVSCHYLSFVTGFYEFIVVPQYYNGCYIAFCKNILESVNLA